MFSGERFPFLCWQLLKQGGDARGSVLLILSDGGETTAPMIADVMPDLLQAGIVVETFSLSQNADEKLNQLAARTGQ